MTNNKALVFGANRDIASRGIGGELARQLRDRGWQVRALYRGAPPVGPQYQGIDWIRGDAMQRGDVLAAAAGCSVIVHAVNLPGYRRYPQLVLPMMDNSIAAAQAHGATLLLPGNVYNFDPAACPLADEQTAQRPQTRKGALRVELERRLEQAVQAQPGRGACRAIVVRAGDYFGPQPGCGWFSQRLVKPGRPVTTVMQPGAAGVGHAWSYLPDVASTMAQLLERRASLPPFAVFHMEGHWDPDGRQMVAAICSAVLRAGGERPTVRAFPWWLLPLAAPFTATARELRELRPLWQHPLRLANRRLLDVLGEEPHTPLDQAVEQSLRGLGCLAPLRAAPRLRG